MYYKILIDETITEKETNQEGEVFYKSICFNKIEEKFGTFEEVLKYLKDRYYTLKLSNINKTENGVYIDDNKGTSKQIGFICNYWNKDISHNSKSYKQKDWIVITEVKEDYLKEDVLNNLIKSLKKNKI